MLPAKYEYLAVLLVLTIFITATAWEQVRALIKERAFWISFAAYVVLCVGLDVTATRAGWWDFPAPTNMGANLAGVPIEEFVLFFVIFLSAVAAWRVLER